MDRTRFTWLGSLLFLLALPVALHAQVTNLSAPVNVAPIPAQTAGALTRAIAPAPRPASAQLPASRIAATFAPLEDMTRRPAALVPMYTTMIALQGYDAYSTLAALKHGAVEINPMAATTAQHPMLFVAVKGVAATTTIYAAERLWRKNRRKSAIAVMIVTNGMLAVAAARNASVLRGQR